MKGLNRKASLVFILPYLVLMGSSGVFAQIQTPPPTLDPISLQLRWHHQFQFAGYYAALEKGFYREAGFDVSIHEGVPSRQPVKEVLAGHADYGVANSEVVWERLQGQPVVALAAIFQHSPLVLLTLRNSAIETPADLAGKRVMSVGGENDVNFRAMFQHQSIPIDAVIWQSSSFQLQDLIDGKTDAFNAYITNEPFFLEEQGLEFNIINPRDYGVDFYSDILFTSEREARDNPDRVRRFRDASIKGWKYALAHPEEIIQLLRKQYRVKKSLNHLRYEAINVHSAIQPELVDVGYISKERLRAMADVYRQQGNVRSLAPLEHFVFDGDEAEIADIRRLWKLSLAILFVATVIVSGLVFFNRRLQKEVKERIAAEEQLKQLADSDALTGLLNRRAFTKRYNDEQVRAQRYNESFSVILIDLDEFKAINDCFGHDAGDRVIVAVAALLKADTRESDRCGRFGGEEFIILLPSTEQEEAEVYANRLCKAIAALEIMLHDGRQLNVTGSIGVAQWQPGDEAEATIIKADNALYQSKTAGRNQATVWLPVAEN